jgi:endogenous inhibitor of DNA gyrase (YacG/DUF329 family)
MPTSVVCPGCQTSFSTEEIDPTQPIHCEKCQQDLNAASNAEEAPIRIASTQPERKSHTLVWTILGFAFALVLVFGGAGGYVAYRFYKWIEGAPSEPKIQGDAPPPPPRQTPGGGPGPKP